MKRTLLVSLFALFLSSNAFADGPVLPSGAAKLPSSVTRLPLRPLPPIVFRCIDPSAARIDTQIVSRTNQWNGRVRITGVVKNVGNAPYASRPNQQLVLLYEVPVGGAPRLVAQRAFQDLPVGAEVSVAFERGWYAASEFQPKYELMVVYDPDIRADGNLENDDCNANDNVRDLAPGAINAMFR